MNNKYKESQITRFFRKALREADIEIGKTQDGKVGLYAKTNQVVSHVSNDKISEPTSQEVYKQITPETAPTAYKDAAYAFKVLKSQGKLGDVINYNTKTPDLQLNGDTIKVNYDSGGHEEFPAPKD
jgi:hypothetical protein